MTPLPTFDKLAALKAAFDADTPFTSAVDQTPHQRFAAGGVPHEADLAFAKAQADGFGHDRQTFDALTNEQSYLLKWAVKKGDPYKAFFNWIEAWTRAVSVMGDLAGGNLIGGKQVVDGKGHPVKGGSPYYRHFELTWPVFDAYRAHPGDGTAIAADIAKMPYGAMIVAWLELA